MQPQFVVTAQSLTAVRLRDWAREVAKVLAARYMSAKLPREYTVEVDSDQRHARDTKSQLGIRVVEVTFGGDGRGGGDWTAKALIHFAIETAGSGGLGAASQSGDSQSWYTALATVRYRKSGTRASNREQGDVRELSGGELLRDFHAQPWTDAPPPSQDSGFSERISSVWKRRSSES